VGTRSSAEAHDGHVTLVDIDDDANLMQFSTGIGDGGYDVYAGLDAEQRPTRLVVDCGLLHLDWPRSG
jgi:hypothetical protein